MSKKFRAYDRVFEPSFGQGLVLSVSKNDSNTENMLVVVFERGNVINYTLDGSRIYPESLPTLLHSYEKAVC